MRTYDLYVAPWDREFLVEKPGSALPTRWASIYLNINYFRDAACKSLAAIIMEQIRRMFNINNDFPPHLYKIYKEENPLGLA
ncbi:hypothetical protein HPB48_026870 [Haemaphysalis longicornis]|uniref:SKP1 component dimerisation domain-containing protein n=1 Tax=Haemaphysalis longicornis TaxID=44386 RepID=A0A9J6HAL6_HAELO|nr:hypothetical protein HPB48_026870 [Haemaphysalis longicornis]